MQSSKIKINRIGQVRKYENTSRTVKLGICVCVNHIHIHFSEELVIRCKMYCLL